MPPCRRFRNQDGKLAPPPNNVLEDIFISATNNLVLTFNNCTEFSDGIQNALCCVSDGGSKRVRQYFHNLKIIVFDIQRPVIINGLNSCITNLDLIDRTMSFEIEPLARRRTEVEINDYFLENHSRFLGGLKKIGDSDILQLSVYCRAGGLSKRCHCIIQWRTNVLLKKKVEQTPAGKKV